MHHTSDYSLILVVMFVILSAIVMAFCQRQEEQANAEFGFKVSYVRNYCVIAICALLLGLSLFTASSATGMAVG